MILPSALVLFHLINGQNTINDYPCSFEIVSNDHVRRADGRYFNFYVEQAECVLGTSLVNDGNYNVFYSGTNTVRYVVMWTNSNGGSIGNGHGRIDPFSDGSSDDWDTGEFIAFHGIDVACGCPS